MTESQISAIRLATGDSEHSNTLLQGIWDSLDATTAIPVTNSTPGSYSVLTVDMSTAFPTFPKKNGNNPDIASFNILMRATTPQLSYGNVNVLSSPYVTYTDFDNKVKTEVIAAPTDKAVTSSGAWMQVSYSYKLVTYNATTLTYDVAAD